MIKVFSTQHLRKVFDEEGKFRSFDNLARDLINNVELFDENGDRISKAEANDAVRKVIFEVLGINEHSSKRDRNRALRRHRIDLFEVLEEYIDLMVEVGFHENEFFNQYVEERNLALGDSQQFYTQDDTLLTVGRVSGDHHDLIIQRLGEGQTYTIETSSYAIKVGTDMDLYLTGRVDWNRLIDACAKAFVVEVQTNIYNAFMGASAQLPSAFKGTGALSTTNKADFDEIIENVSVANGNVPVVIIGTQTALKKITALADVDWASAGQKDDIATMGRLGSYEGTALIQIPQRFANKTDFSKLIDNTKLLVIPNTEDRFVKFVDEGETEILEYTERGDYMDDSATYEMQRKMGVGVALGRYFGEWTLTT